MPPFGPLFRSRFDLDPRERIDDGPDIDEERGGMKAAAEEPTEKADEPSAEEALPLPWRTARGRRFASLHEFRQWLAAVRVSDA